MYKILAKVLANRLKSVIRSIISDAQSTFIKGRHIMYDIVIANEVINDANKRKKKIIMFKVDFEKAYNYVEWGCLDYVRGTWREGHMVLNERVG